MGGLGSGEHVERNTQGHVPSLAFHGTLGW